MNSRAQLVRRLCGDLVQRLRIALGSTGEDANLIVDQLDRNLAENIAGDVCATIGIDYEGPEAQLAPDGKPGGKARANSPWQKRKGIDLGGKRPQFGKDKV
jgi:hypothetical protein